MENNVLFALGLTLFAGLSTGIGSLIGFMSKQFNPRFLTIALGFSAGVMIYVSMIEIFVKAKDSLTVDKLIPSYENPHEMNVEQKIKDSTDEQKSKLMRMGMFSALAIGIHNFPEGLATFMSGLTNPTLGVSIAVAIAIHNIPEGLAVSAPIFYATKSRKKAFVLSFLSGLAEPIGALIGYFVLRSIFNEATFGIIFASVAGIIMENITLPSAG
jgi:ZIP family zinc transporter